MRVYKTSAGIREKIPLFFALSPRTHDALAACSLHRRPQQTLTKTQGLFLVKTDEKIMKSGVGKRVAAVEIVLRD